MSLPDANIRARPRISRASGTRPNRVSRRELVRVERNQKRTNVLLLSWSAWMADRRPRPLRADTRRSYLTAVKKAIRLAGQGGYSLLADDVRAVRYVLGKLSPHPGTQNNYRAAL